MEQQTSVFDMKLQPTNLTPCTMINGVLYKFSIEFMNLSFQFNKKKLLNDHLTSF